jgi:hypothetical protein
VSAPLCGRRRALDLAEGKSIFMMVFIVVCGAVGKSFLMMVFIVVGMTLSFLSLSCVVFCSSRFAMRSSLNSVSFLCFFSSMNLRIHPQVAIQGM